LIPTGSRAAALFSRQPGRPWSNPVLLNKVIEPFAAEADRAALAALAKLDGRAQDVLPGAAALRAVDDFP